MKINLSLLTLSSSLLILSSIETQAMLNNEIYVSKTSNIQEKNEDIFKKIENIYFNPNKNSNNISQAKQDLLKQKCSVLKRNAYSACLTLTQPTIDKTSQESAFKDIKKYARADDPFILYVLASLYEKGIGTQPDLMQAVTLYKKAHELGSVRVSEPYNRLGIAFMLGKSIKKDEKVAFELFKRASTLGNMTALYNLGRCYEKGQGIEKSPSKAVEYYKTVSDSEDPNKLKALFKLAEFYRDGKGVNQDFGQAIENYEKIDTLLKEEEKTKAICLFNLGVLYHKQKPYDLETLEKVLQFYEKAQQIDLEGLNIEAQKLKYNNFSDQIEKCQQHIFCCKKSKEIIEKNYEKLDEKVKKAILNHGPKLFPNHLIDENDILNIFGILASLKNANTIETFVSYLENIFNHNSVKMEEKTYYKIQMIKKFSQVSLDKLKLIVENASALFTPQMTWEEILSVVASVNEIEDVEKLKTILSLCPHLFVKTHISSSEDDEKYGTIQVQKKIQEMDGIDRATILRLLGEVKTENLPMILLCVNTTLTPHVKASEIINAIDKAKNVLQPQNKDLSQLNLTAIDINKIPIITQFIPQLFNGKETLEKKIGIFNIIGKADLHQIEHLIGNSLKLIHKGMLGGHKIEILQMCQSVEQEKFEKILPYVLSIIDKEKRNSFIVKIFTLFDKINDLKEISSLCSVLSKDLSDGQKSEMLETLTQIPFEEREEFSRFSQYILNKQMDKEKTKGILQAFKKLSRYMREAVARFIGKQERAFEEVIQLLEDIDHLSQKGCGSDDIVSFLSFKQGKPHLSDSKVFQALKDIEDFKVLAHVLKNKSCLEILDKEMSPQKIGDIFNITHDMKERDLERVAPYVSLLMTESMSNERVRELIEKLINIDSEKLQTVVFHVSTSPSSKKTHEELFKNIQETYEYISKEPNFIFKKSIPVEDFSVFLKFTSKIFCGSKYIHLRIEEADAILQRILKAEDPFRLRILLEDCADHLEKIFQRFMDWEETDGPGGVLKSSLFNRDDCSLKYLEEALPLTSEFCTKDMSVEDIESIFTEITEAISRGYLKDFLLNARNFITKDMWGNTRVSFFKRMRTMYDQDLHTKEKKLENVLQITHKFMTEYVEGDARWDILRTISYMKEKEREKIITYAPEVLKFISIQKSGERVDQILKEIIKYTEEELKEIFPHFFEWVEIESKFYEKAISYKNRFSRSSYNRKEKLEDVAEKFKVLAEASVEDRKKICESIKKLARERDEGEAPTFFTPECTSSINPLLRILRKLDIHKHDEIVSYALESERIYQEHYKGHSTSYMGETLKSLGKAFDMDRLAKVFNCGKEYIKIKPNYNNNYSYIYNIFKTFNAVKDKNDLEPIHNFAQLCIHDQMDRCQLFSIIRCLSSKFISIPEAPSQFFMEALKDNERRSPWNKYNATHKLLWIFDSRNEMELEEIVPYARELRKCSIEHEEYNSFEEKSLLFNGTLLGSIHGIDSYSGICNTSIKEKYKEGMIEIKKCILSKIKKLGKINGFALLGILQAIEDFSGEKEYNEEYKTCILTFNWLLPIQQAFTFLEEEIFLKEEKLIDPRYAFFRKKASEETEIKEAHEIFKNQLKKPLKNKDIEDNNVIN